MNLTQTDRIQLRARALSFGRGVGENLVAFSKTIEELLASPNELALYQLISYLREIKSAVQGVHNLNHELACLAAKAYLQPRYPTVNWAEVSLLQKDANASGPDLLIEREDLCIVGEVKTTEPQKLTDFGAAQKREITKDLKALLSASFTGYHRYFLVTSPRAYHILQQKYVSEYPGIYFVLLTASATGNETVIVDSNPSNLKMAETPHMRGDREIALMEAARLLDELRLCKAFADSGRVNGPNCQRFGHRDPSKGRWSWSVAELLRQASEKGSVDAQKIQDIAVRYGISVAGNSSTGE